MNPSQDEQNIFEQDNVRSVYFHMAIPVVLGLVISLIYNLTDTYFVARTGNTDLVAGVSLGAPLFTFLMALGNIFGQGGTSLFSRLLGSREVDAVRRISSFCFWAAIVCGAVIGVVLMLVRAPMVWLLGADEGTYPYALQYYTVLAVGAPVILLDFIHLNLLRAEGMSRESMYGSILGSVVNIVLDPVLILGLGMGAGGAAIASVIGYLCSCVYFALIVLRRSRVMTISPRQAHVSREELLQILSVGIPASLANIMTSVATILLNQFLLPYGSERIAAMGIAMKVYTIVSLILIGLTYGGIPVYGYYFGAQNRRKLRELFSFCKRFISAVAVVLSALVFAAAPLLLRLFMDNDTIVTHGTMMLRCLVVTSVFTGFILLIQTICQAAGEGAGAMVLTLGRQGIIFLLALFLCSALLGYPGILIAQPISDIVTFVFAVLIYRLRLKNRTGL